MFFKVRILGGDVSKFFQQSTHGGLKKGDEFATVLTNVKSSTTALCIKGFHRHSLKWLL
jgi:hypothetical protein